MTDGAEVTSLPHTQHGRAWTASAASCRVDGLEGLGGRTNQQIADALVISRNTVRHVSNVFDKTGVANRAQAALYARDNGLA